MATIPLGILGDFNPEYPTHRATNESIQHAAKALREPLEAVWLPTDEPQCYERFQGFLCAPGSPYKSFEGALAGIRYAREHGVPFLGTCGGFQHLVIEYARNVMGIRDAAHAETDPYASSLVVTQLSCSLVGKAMDVTITPRTQAARIFPGLQSSEAFYCNFGLNPAYKLALQTAGLKDSGTSHPSVLLRYALRSPSQINCKFSSSADSWILPSCLGAINKATALSSIGVIEFKSYLAQRT
jgi:CTP synthase (UTP-ammonia lyase)